MADPDGRPVTVEVRHGAPGERLVDDVDGIGIGTSLLDDRVDDLVEGIAHGPAPVEVGARPGPGVALVEDTLPDEPAERIRRALEAVDELAGFELARVQEVEGGFEIEA